MAFNYRRWPTLYFALLLLAGCNNMAPKFDEVAYQRTISLKTESIALIKKATHDYTAYKEDVTRIQQNLDKLYNRAKSNKKNSQVAKQWNIMRDSKKNMLAGFFKVWKERNSLNKVYVNEAASMIASGFDKIIQLEDAKRQLAKGGK